MENIIRKILRESDFEWAGGLNELPLDEITDLNNQHDKILTLKNKLIKYLEGKVGTENIDYSERQRIGSDVYNKKYNFNQIVDEVRSIYNEVNNIEHSLRDLESNIEHLHYLVTGEDLDEDE